MACYFPRIMYRPRVPVSGVVPGPAYDPAHPGVFTTSRNAGQSGIPVRVPCGVCIPCLQERARIWGMRCMHEKRVSERSCFVTLTYEKEPDGGTLVREHPQLFLKRLRFKYGVGIRYFGCGEYGGRTFRPHYHLLLFNVDFRDSRRYRKKSGSGEPLYCSTVLDDVWSYGNCWIGDVTFASAKYVAGYCLKKVTGSQAEAYYGGRLPEFSMMSRRPGIGMGWYRRFNGEMYQHDSAIMDGKEVSPGKYYDLKFKEEKPDGFKKIHRQRLQEVDRSDNTHERRLVKDRLAKLTWDRFGERKD